jgi:hypothetical protein
MERELTVTLGPTRTVGPSGPTNLVGFPHGFGFCHDLLRFLAGLMATSCYSGGDQALEVNFRLWRLQRAAPMRQGRFGYGLFVSFNHRSQPFNWSSSALDILEVGGVEAFGEPAVDIGKQGPCLIRPPRFYQQRARLVVARNFSDLALCLRAISIGRSKQL